MTSEQALKQYFGYDSFRGGQQELIEAVLSGQDVLGIMPTGAGKSICFQLPAMMQQGIALIISPLISLMKDQVGALIQAGIAAAYINSSLSARQVQLALENARRGKYKLIYVAPERLLSADFLDFAQNAEISMLTVDEAHCISQWGQDFRPSYLQVPAFLKALPTRPVVSAFTATATRQVKQDIASLLEMQSPKVLVTGFDRENLYFDVQTPKDKMQALISFLREGAADASGIVYCATRKTVEEVSARLLAQGFSASRYHAGLGDAERQQNQDDFLFDRVRIMVATNAFGMGIDKSNVSFVVHYNMPKDIESYYQEAGRAGRDQSRARCLLFYSGQDVRTNQWMIENGREPQKCDEQTQRQLRERDHRRLREMTFYSTTNDCLRGFILRYFGETPPLYCGNCGSCDTKFDSVDVTEEAQKILACVGQMGGRFGVGMVVDVLRGSKNERLLSFGLDRLPCYATSQKPLQTLRAVIDHLLRTGYLKSSEGQYSLLQQTELSDEILHQGQGVTMKLAREKAPQQREQKGQSVLATHEQITLHARLRQLRAELARAQRVPAYVIFSDYTLAEICQRLPKTPQQLLLISGVGEAKLKRYGDLILEAVEAAGQADSFSST